MTDALTDLQDMVERIRREADAAGYARAWAEMRDISTAHAAPVLASDMKPENVAAREWFETSGTSNIRISAAGEHQMPSPRASRGANKYLVENAMRASNRNLNAREIQILVGGSSERPMAYSSVQQALKQLEEGGVVIRGDDNRYRFREQPDPPEEEAFG